VIGDEKQANQPLGKYGETKGSMGSSGRPIASVKRQGQQENAIERESVRQIEQSTHARLREISVHTMSRPCEQ